MAAPSLAWITCLSKASEWDYENILDFTIEYVFETNLSQKRQPQPLLKRIHEKYYIMKSQNETNPRKL